MTEISDTDLVRRAHRSELDPVTFLWRSEFVYPDRVAVVHEDRRYTYRQLAERVRRLASALQGAGLVKGDRVAVIAPNIPALLEAHYGVPAAGGVLVAVNYRLTADDVGFIIRHSGSRFVLVDHEYSHLVSDLGDDTAVERVVRIDDTGAAGDPYEDLLAGGSADPLAAVLSDEDEPISVNYTSGTTGRPKGAVYHHRGAYLNALGEVVETRLSPESVYLWTLPMFHCNGWCFTWAVCAVGGRHVCLRKVDPGRIWDLIDAEEVTHYNGAPTVQNSLLDHEKAHPLDREVITTVSGSPPNAELFTRLTEHGIRPIHVYGSTELYGPYMICERQPEWDDLPLAQQAELLGRQGVHYLVAEPVRVVDDQGDEVAADGETLGEVLMRGNNVMTGYLDDPEQTDEALGDGWYHSGDLAVRHPDGYIELRDRKKDIIVSGGENISTIAVEQALAEHPAVAEVAVVSTPDERWGERPKAFVELASGGDASEEDILAFAKEHLAGFMRPVAVEITELPKTSTGKIQKKDLRDREWEGHERRAWADLDEDGAVPYLRVTCPPLEDARRREVAEALTAAVVELFTPPRGPTAADIRARTTVHFAAYGPDELFVGGRAANVDDPDVTVELSDWSMSPRQQAKVAARLTPVLVGLFAARPDAVNLRFHPYPPTDFAVGGVLLAARIPRPVRWAKRLLG